MYSACQPGSLIYAHLRPHPDADLTIAHSLGCTAPSRRAQGSQGPVRCGVGPRADRDGGKAATTALTRTSPLTHKSLPQLTISPCQAAQHALPDAFLLPAHSCRSTARQCDRGGGSGRGGGCSRRSEGVQRVTGFAAATGLQVCHVTAACSPH